MSSTINHSCSVDENIFWFDVPMHESHLVKVVNTQGNLKKKVKIKLVRLQCSKFTVWRTYRLARSEQYDTVQRVVPVPGTGNIPYQ
jgi:hypothetical protein